MKRSKVYFAFGVAVGVFASSAAITSHVTYRILSIILAIISMTAFLLYLMYIAYSTDTADNGSAEDTEKE